MRVTEIWRYPVKSMQGERLQDARIDEVGIAGDRTFALRDPESGRLYTGRRLPALLMCRAVVVDHDQVEITVPNHGRVRSNSPDVDGRLSKWLELPVQLVRSDMIQSARYDLPVPEEVVEIYGTGRATDLVVGCEAGFKDVAQIHVLATTDLQGRSVRRFRPNLVVDTGGEPLLPGARLSVGEVELEISKPTVRCVMVTRAQPGLGPAAGLLRKLVERSRARVGVYASVRRGGLLSAH